MQKQFERWIGPMLTVAAMIVMFWLNAADIFDYTIAPLFVFIVFSTLVGCYVPGAISGVFVIVFALFIMPPEEWPRMVVVCVSAGMVAGMAGVLKWRLIQVQHSNQVKDQYINGVLTRLHQAVNDLNVAENEIKVITDLVSALPQTDGVEVILRRLKPLVEKEEGVRELPLLPKILSTLGNVVAAGVGWHALAMERREIIGKEESK